MGAVRVASAVKDDLSLHIKLDPINIVAIAIMTGANNGANVVFKAYVGINGVRYDQAVEMLKPDNSAVAVTSLTGALKAGCIPTLAGPFTDFWLIRTDADVSIVAEATVNVSST